MSWCEYHWFSNVLGKQVGADILLPDCGKPPFATYYLLHGLSDDHTIWHRRTRIESYVERLPLIVVMPDGFRGFYTNCATGPAYAKYIAEELTAVIERNFPAKRTRSGRCVGGLSMGGYGAMRLALGYPDRFVSANSHSGAVMRGSQTSKASNVGDFDDVFGRDPTGSDHDLLALARKVKKAGQLPRLRLDCGTEDFLLQDNRQFHEKLTAMDVAHEYEEFPGTHEWGYWDLHVQQALEFHSKALRIKPVK